MNIIFIGTVQFSKTALLKLVQLGCPPSGVITQPSSAFNSDYVSLAPICKQYDIECRFEKNINSLENVEWIKGQKPDVIFCFGWSSLIRQEVLSIPKLGVIGFHPAALPENRGRHPIIWALALGLKETASSFFFMDEGADSGDILSQVPVKINYRDDAASLYDKISQTAMKQIELFIPQLKMGTFPRQHQDHSQSNIWRKRKKKDGRIDFRMSSRSIYNLVRALTKPYIGAHLEYKGLEIKVWETEEYEYPKPNIEPGKIIFSTSRKLVIKCGEGAIRLIKHDFTKLPEVGEYLI